MKWKLPPRVKVFEALGCIGDERIKVTGNEAEVYSSSGGKTYHVVYDPERNEITANDNGSYWQGYLGYPAIAFLIAKGVVRADHNVAKALKGIPWKDTNTKFKSDYAKTEDYALAHAEVHGNIERSLVEKEVDEVMKQLEELSLSKLGATAKPPEGY